MNITLIANAVEVDAGVKRLSMRFIKQCAAPERERLSPELCEQITDAFEGHGLLTVPRKLPTSENEWVFVLSKDSPLGQAVSLAGAVIAMSLLGIPPLPDDLDDRFPELVSLGKGQGEWLRGIRK
ncbi:hypothetical protein OU787_08495 [Kitasatospora sp. YST-16]|uniref:hypothetical protein n=1 Tax=Kitasatospora sp. YST-16 TaxID=2998080 RepID=UPI002284E7D8|nr:hypothetical protein [Kitasatospora sp. YST-16]WAL71537.1 hypothetical protein OU787_08495 [Kitasatospora sp. YST-16]WNW37577.1 hypothetical protein RKE32_08440 [Streptomyces sp. Li-HN-5-13]